MTGRINLLNINFEKSMSVEEVRDEFKTIMNYLEESLKEKKKIGDVQSKKWQHSVYIELDTSAMNCTKCSICGKWTTDINKPDPVFQLKPGAIFDGKMVCESCYRLQSIKAG